MITSNYRKPGLKDLSGLSKAELETLVHGLVEAGKVSPEDVNEGVASIRAATEEMVKRASGIEHTRPEKLLDPEEAEALLGTLKARFEEYRILHEDVQWSDVEKALRADPESMNKLHSLDEKGHKMNVFGEEKGELIFASGWSDYNEVSADHRNVVFDDEAQRYLKEHYHPNESCNGNATDIVKALGVDLADPKFHEQLRKAVDVNGWAWLKTDAATRKAGYAFYGLDVGIFRNLATGHVGYGSFRAALRVKKA